MWAKTGAALKTAVWLGEYVTESPSASPPLYSSAKLKQLGMEPSIMKKEYVAQVRDILNLKGCGNCILVSKVMVMWLNLCILPIGGVSLGRICACTLLSRLALWRKLEKSNIPTH